MKPAAILWDYDGTLVDSAVKNRLVTIELLQRFDARVEEHLPPALQTVESYRRAQLRWARFGPTDWRQLCQREYGLSVQQTEQLGENWAATQHRQPLQPPLFGGLRAVLPQLAALAPMGVCSRNTAAHIARTLGRYGVADCFGSIIGWQQVAADRQKPDPAAFLQCLRQLGVRGDEGPLVYIGDSALDVQFAHAAARQLAQAGRGVQVYTVITRFGDWRDIAAPAREAASVRGCDGCAPNAPAPAGTAGRDLADGGVCGYLPPGADGCVSAPCQLPTLLKTLCGF